jgi:hypothetical protein
MRKVNMEINMKLINTMNMDLTATTIIMSILNIILKSIIMNMDLAANMIMDITIKRIITTLITIIM